jgi:cation:H+ antiporter
MPNVLVHVCIFLISFITIWFGSGLIVTSVTKISNRLRISQFFISFIVLGILTSTPEIAVGISAISVNNPSVFVGNLLGGIPILYLLVIPLLAICGNGISIRSPKEKQSIILSIIIAIAPFLIVLDQKVTNPEGVFLIVIYVVSIICMGVNQENPQKKNERKVFPIINLIKIVIGAALVFVSSRVIVSNTLFFSEVLQIAPFYLSLFLLSFGTNLPEITLALRSVFSKKKSIAFGDYLGSASANTLLFGIFTLCTKDAVLHVSNFLPMFGVMCAGFFLFYRFAKTKEGISRGEGFVLFLVYLIFAYVELLTK